jgi:hypothetical protein
MEAAKSLATEILSNLGFQVDEIPVGDGRTADMPLAELQAESYEWFLSQRLSEFISKNGQREHVEGDADRSTMRPHSATCSQIAEQRFEHISSCTHFPTSVINVPRRGSQPGTAGSPVSDISPLGASA